jgi:ketosteroid isomerase-like protein
LTFVAPIGRIGAMPHVAEAVLSDVANGLFDGIERGDEAAVEDLWADDVTVWHSGDTEDNDRTRALKVIKWFIRTTTERSYEILDRQFYDGGFVQQHVLRADGTNGSSITLRVCIVIKINADGLIVRIDEYFDPAEMAPLLQR